MTPITAAQIKVHPEEEVKSHAEIQPKKTSPIPSNIESLTKKFFGNELCKICKPKINETIPNLMAKMLKNQRKAIEEHQAKFGFFERLSIKLGIQRNFYATVDEGLPSIEELEKFDASKPLTLHHAEKNLCFPINVNRDFKLDKPNWMLTGIFTGYSMNFFDQLKAQDLAYNANDLVKFEFEKAFNLSNENVHLALTSTIHYVHRYMDNKNYRKAGVIGVLTFIDKRNYKVYTATIGHKCEATIYRQIKGRLKTIPLSCQRHWASKKDAERAAKYSQCPNIATEWPKNDPENLYIGTSFLPPNVYYLSYNVSRGLGENVASNEPGRVIHKPKITVNKLMTGDIVLLSSQVYRNGISDRTIADVLFEHQKSCVLKDGNDDAGSGCLFCKESCESPADHISKHIIKNKMSNEFKIVTIDVR